jgi:peptidoglycan biosynthesis protein MviN/MurJ (putative lipid II flippase)
MTKSKLNLIIDAVLLLAMAAMTGIGVLMKYVLIPGYARWVTYGRNVELFFWGLDRHEWGTIHFVIGLVLIAGIVLHVVLHWEQVVAVYCKLIPDPLLRLMITVILICITVLLLAFPALVKPQVAEGGHEYQQRQETAIR